MFGHREILSLSIPLGLVEEDVEILDTLGGLLNSGVVHVGSLQGYGLVRGGLGADSEGAAKLRKAGLVVPWYR